MESKRSLSDIKKSIESMGVNRGGDQHNRTQHRSPTVDELLRMLTNKGLEHDESYRRAPPIPPKPIGTRKPNTSTVEISEIEVKSNCSPRFGSNETCNMTNNNNENNIIINTNNNNNNTISNNNNNNNDNYNNNSTFSRPKLEKLFLENNFAIPVVTSPTDDEDGDDIIVSSEVDVESILDESDTNQPPRTSTPSFECTTSPSDTLSQIADKTHNSTYTKLFTDNSNSGSNNNGDPLNESRDTDTCVFNQSGGCEIVDVENIDPLNNSNGSPRNATQSSYEKTPFKYNYLEHSGNQFTTPRFSNSMNQTTLNSSVQDKKVEELEKLTTTLMYEVRRLSQQVDDLSSQMNALHISSDSISNLNLSTSGYDGRITSPLVENPSKLSYSQQMSSSPISKTYNRGLSKSISTIHSSSIPSTVTTLRRDFNSTFDSISNLSQIGQAHSITNWPSTSDFIPAKHGAKEITFNPEDRLVRMSLYDNQINLRIPDWAPRDYNIDKVIEPPSVRLKLSWVHGYRGRDCRCNLYFLPTGECVYFVASIVVLYDPNQNTQRHYLGHTDSVKCLAIHPNRLIIASGQSAIQKRRDKRPIVRVWNTVHLTTLRVIGFNEDFDRSICCLAFSKHDCGATLAVVDESNEHTITLLDWQKEKNWRVAEANSGHEPVLAIDFHPIDKYMLVAVGKSSINFWDIRGMTMSKKAGLFDKYDKPKYVLCLTFNDIGETLTGDSNGNVMIWPLGSNRPRKIIPNIHAGGVFSIMTMKDRTFLTGGKDRRIVEWDENCNPTGREIELPEHCGGVRYITNGRANQVVIGTLRNCILLGSLDDSFSLIMQGHAEATSALAVHPYRCEYLTGGLDEQLHVFDATDHKVLWSKCLTMPACSAAYSPDESIIVVGSTSGKWLVIDPMSQQILFSKCDGTGTISCLQFSPDGMYLAMGSTDTQIYLYQVTNMGNMFLRIGACSGHSGPIKEMDWSNDGMFLQTQSMNFELLVWRTTSCRLVKDMRLLDNVQWSTQNCTIGFSVIGIWSDESTLIEYCEKSKENDIVVSTTDTGYINVFKWPAIHNQCIPQRFYGNVDKFTNIKFMSNGQKLVAIGAKNCITTEWNIDKASQTQLGSSLSATLSTPTISEDITEKF